MLSQIDNSRDLCGVPVTSISFSIIKIFIMPALHGFVIARAKQVFRTLPVWGRELFSDIRVCLINAEGHSHSQEIVDLLFYIHIYIFFVRISIYLHLYKERSGIIFSKNICITRGDVIYSGWGKYSRTAEFRY